jgi:hypothetical protein
MHQASDMTMEATTKINTHNILMKMSYIGINIFTDQVPLKSLLTISTAIQVVFHHTWNESSETKSISSTD